MATLNDFKVIKANSKKMFGFVETEKKIKKKLDDDTKARLGFYHLVLESVTQSSNINDIADAIIDQEYNTIVFDQCTDDLGVDAVWFSHNGIEKEVSLFNFKYSSNHWQISFWVSVESFSKAKKRSFSPLQALPRLQGCFAVAAASGKA